LFFIEPAAFSEQAIGMPESVPKSIIVPRQPFGLSLVQFIIFKFVVMSVFVALLASLQGWAAKSSYNPENCADFKMGFLHGVLLPAAFPALVAGHNLPIYAPNNTGCNYKIGLLLGLNSCGSVFFGLAYWGMGKRPKRSPS
jgi:hypothetical protein